MSAAHELIKRGYDVHVYEKNKLYCGGKARSVNVPGTNLQEPDKYLPGEHGFRFFPGFYKHVTATMLDIPFVDENGKKTGKGRVWKSCSYHSNHDCQVRKAIYCYGGQFSEKHEGDKTSYS